MYAKDYFNFMHLNILSNKNSYNYSHWSIFFFLFPWKTHRLKEESNFFIFFIFSIVNQEESNM